MGLRAIWRLLLTIRGLGVQFCLDLSRFVSICPGFFSMSLEISGNFAETSRSVCGGLFGDVRFCSVLCGCVRGMTVDVRPGARMGGCGRKTRGWRVPALRRGVSRECRLRTITGMDTDLLSATRANARGLHRTDILHRWVATWASIGAVRRHRGRRRAGGSSAGTVGWQRAGPGVRASGHAQRRG